MRALLGTTLGTLLSLAACASGSGQGPTSKNATASGKSEPTMICREEAPTGSLFTHTVCRSPEQVEDERNSGQEMLRRQRGTSGPDQPIPTLQPPAAGPR
jgi:hypothetical protein